jgi:hypothetical protein
MLPGFDVGHLPLLYSGDRRHLARGIRTVIAKDKVSTYPTHLNGEWQRRRKRKNERNEKRKSKGERKTERKTNLHPNYNSVQIKHRLPILPQNIQTNIPLQINIRMVNLLRTLNLRRIMREILVHGETEMERATFIHALVGFDGKSEVQDVVGVRKGHFHSASEG